MRLRSIILLVFLTIFLNANAQKNKAEKKNSTADQGYKFTKIVDLKATPVKDQAATGTCWDFATTSFIESELLREGKGEYDLSEMYIVRYNFVDRMEDNFKKGGNGNITGGGQAHDWMIEFGKNGLVPDETYTGLNYGSPSHDHGELNAYMKAISTVPVRMNKESDQYYSIMNSILDIYLGKVPGKFTYKGVDYTPKSFSESLGINPDDYVELTSFTLFPFYTKGVVPYPDNWRNYSDYNVPIDDLISIMDYSLNHGYTVDWDGDVSERGFSHRNGVAIMPELENTDQYSKADKARLGNLSPEERKALAYKFAGPFPEVKVTQESREAGYDNRSTTDDHGMHITGIVKDQNGTKYYITKNSWGTDGNPFGGYLNMSEQYVRAKTVFIMVNKEGIPTDIKNKLGIK